MGRIPLTNEEPVIDEQPVKKIETPLKTSEESDSIELPYTDNPDFLGEYFKIGTEWKDQDAVFEEEIGKIDNYVRSKIDSGEIANTPKAVSDLLKHMEKFNNVKNEERAVVKIEVLANYAEFLSKNERLRSNLRRYSGAV